MPPRVLSVIPPMTQLNTSFPSTAYLDRLPAFARRGGRAGRPGARTGAETVLGGALNKSLYNYMHGLGLDEDVRGWFDLRVPKTRVPRHFIARALASA